MSRAKLTTGLGLAAILLAGCGSLGGPQTEVTIFSPQTSVEPEAAWPQADWQLSVGVQSSSELIDTTRIAVRPTANELQSYKGARWSDPAPDLLETALVQAFEDSGRISGVTRFGGAGRGNFGLVVDVRAFETVYSGGQPEAVIEAQGRLVQFRGRNVVTKRFRQSVPGNGADIASMVDAFSQAMSAISGEIVGWTLVEGNRLDAVPETGAPDAVDED